MPEAPERLSSRQRYDAFPETAVELGCQVDVDEFMRILDYTGAYLIKRMPELPRMFDLGFVRLKPVLVGAFDTMDEDFDATRHSLYVSAAPSAGIRTALSGGTPSRSDGASSMLPKIGNVSFNDMGDTIKSGVRRGLSPAAPGCPKAAPMCSYDVSSSRRLTRSPSTPRSRSSSTCPRRGAGSSPTSAPSRRRPRSAQKGRRSSAPTASSRCRAPESAPRPSRRCLRHPRCEGYRQIRPNLVVNTRFGHYYYFQYTILTKS